MRQPSEVQFAPVQNHSMDLICNQNVSTEMSLLSKFEHGDTLDNLNSIHRAAPSNNSFILPADVSA